MCRYAHACVSSTGDLHYAQEVAVQNFGALMLHNKISKSWWVMSHVYDVHAFMCYLVSHIALCFLLKCILDILWCCIYMHYSSERCVPFFLHTSFLSHGMCVYTWIQLLSRTPFPACELRQWAQRSWHIHFWSMQTNYRSWPVVSCTHRTII